MRRKILPLVTALLLASATASGQQVASTPEKLDCPPQAPDSLEISWNAPCEQGDWLFDTQNGCRMWDWHPEPRDTAVWNGACAHGARQGRGVVQWYEHGKSIDRFEGTFRDDKREGFGRYQWNATARFEGHYADDVPDGFGTAQLEGETFSGEWKNGCFAKGRRVVAIGVPRTSCSSVPPVALAR